MKRLVLMGAVTGLALSAGLAAQTPNDWPTVGNDPGGMKYSSLTQITPANVSKLAKAWTYDMGVPASGYTVTPIVVNNVMYFPVQGSIIVALKADTGTELWKCDLTTIPGSRRQSLGRRPRHLVLARHCPGRRRASSSPRPTGSSSSSTRSRASRLPGPAGLINLSTGRDGEVRRRVLHEHASGALQEPGDRRRPDGRAGPLWHPRRSARVRSADRARKSGDSMSFRGRARRTSEPGAWTAGRIAAVPASGCR